MRLATLVSNQSRAILVVVALLCAAGLYAAWQLPVAILPQTDSLHTWLWDAHFYLAFAFFALVLMHVAAALFHALVRRDGVFETMASVSSHDEVVPAE